jgi:hypothetical protein
MPVGTIALSGRRPVTALAVGTYGQQVAVMAGQYTVDLADGAALVAQSVHRACPAEISVLP